MKKTEVYIISKELVLGNVKIKEGNFYFNFKTEDNKVIMDFKDSKMKDATYAYLVKENTLLLIGKEGTVGGEYTLKKVK